MCGHHNVRPTAIYNTGQNTEKGHKSSPRIDIKIPDPAENRARVTGLEGWPTTRVTSSFSSCKSTLLFTRARCKSRALKGTISKEWRGE